MSARFTSVRPRFGCLFLVLSLSGFSAKDAVSSMVQIRLEAVDTAGKPVSEIDVNSRFDLLGWVEDIRTDSALGVFAAYADVAFDASKVQLTGPVEPGEMYANGLDLDVTNQGLLDEVGGFSSSLAPLGEGEFLLFRAPMRATAPGTVVFFPDAADDLPFHETLVYGTATAVNVNDVVLAGSLLSVRGVVAGDVDGDGVVSLTDFNMLKTGFGNLAACPSCDLNGDSLVDLRDFSILKNNFGPSSQSVPEPNAGLLAIVAFGALCCLGPILRNSKCLCAN